MSFTVWRYPARRFVVDGERFAVWVKARSDATVSSLWRGRELLAEDRTPAFGPEAVRNHRLTATLADGRPLEVEAGYINLYNTGIRVFAAGNLVHESHPGRTVAYPEAYREKVARSGNFSELMAKENESSGVDIAVWKRNRVPIAVDLILMLLFFVVAKLTDLPTAAIVGAGVGLALVVAQRFVKVDLLGGLALFGIIMLLISAGLAVAFQDDMAVKMRTTIVGMISAAFFIGDGLLGGKRLGRGLSRYLVYTDLDHGRLAIGIGLTGLVMAGLNYLVALAVSTSTWLIYSTFLDLPLGLALFLVVIHYARTGRSAETGAEAQAGAQGPA